MSIQPLNYPIGKNRFFSGEVVPGQSPGMPVVRDVTAAEQPVSRSVSASSAVQSKVAKVLFIFLQFVVIGVKLICRQNCYNLF